MKMNTRRRYLYSLLALLLMATAKGATTDKAAADTLYAQGQYEVAAKAYADIIAEQGEAAALDYNIGNCYYKMDDIPHAILYYERALLLNPSDDDIRANLTLARSKAVDKVTPPSEMFFVTWWKSLTNAMNIDQWKTVAAIAFSLMLIGLLCYLLRLSLVWRKAGFYGAVLAGIVCLTANLLAYSQHRAITHRHTAIITTPAVTVQSSPDAASTSLFVIHEGSRVELLGEPSGNWYEVWFEEGKQGWVPTASFEII